MSLVVALAVVLSACVLPACHDPLAARVRPLPTPDGRTPLRGGGPARSPRIASYVIDVKLDAVRHALSATQKLVWTNTGSTAVDVLPFHLYLNAFKNESTLFMTTSRGEMRGAKASVQDWGWIQIDSIRTAGAELVSTLRFPGPDETVVELPLAAPVAPGAQIELELAFTAQLPRVFARTGHHGEFHMVGQWFPKIGVRTGLPGEERWDCAPFHINAEFFADFGTYDVSITVPNTFVVAATGVLTAAAEAPGGTRTLTDRAEDVHDFVWMADPYMEVKAGQARVDGDPVEIRVLYRPEQEDFARRHLAAATGAVERFGARLLPYPWPIMTIVDPPLAAIDGAGGMEYPTLVTTAGDSVFAPPGVRLPEYVTVHEVGHNWLGGILASNEVLEAWMDEGVNEWLDAKVMADLYGARGSGIDWMGWQAEISALRAAMMSDPRSLPSPIATAAAAFVDNRAYGEVTYAKTARALETLENLVGSAKIDAAMKSYASSWAFKHPTGRDLFDHLARETGADLAWFERAFREVGGHEIALRTAGCRVAHPPRGTFGTGPERKVVGEREAPDRGTFVCEVVVSNTGAVHTPVEIDLVFADHSTERVQWSDPGKATWERFVIERSSRLIEVHIDPDRKLALTSPVEHHYRLQPDASAAIRAGAWTGSLAQTLMQVVGP